MPDRQGHDGLPQGSPVRMFAIILIISVMVYGPLFTVTFLMQDEDLKQQTMEATVLLMGQHYSQAEAAWQKILKKHPGNTDAYIGLGITYTQMARYDEAESVFAEGLQKHPDDKRLVFNRALLYLHQGEHRRSEEVLNALLARDRQYPEAYYHLGFIAEQGGDYPRARDLYVQELNVNAACAKAWYRLEVLTSNDLVNNQGN
ncbi:tetratricopeptide repeat protein [Planctomycetota bacterium]